MPITSIRNERNIDEIATRVYGNLSAEHMVLARAALLRANPQLNPSARPPVGAVVRVPETPELRPRRIRGMDEPGSTLVAAAAESLADLRKALRAAARTERDDAAAQSRLLKTRAAKALIGSHADIKTLAASVDRTAKKRQADAKNLEAFAARTLEAMEKDLEELESALR